MPAGPADRSTGLRLIDQFRAERTAGSATCGPAKPKTVHNDTVTIRQLVNFALERDLITEDPLRGLKLKKPKRTPQPCWTREQVDSILTTAVPPHSAVPIFLAETGARVGEARWLTWDDVDLDRRFIHIRRRRAGSRSRGTSAWSPSAISSTGC